MSVLFAEHVEYYLYIENNKHGNVCAKCSRDALRIAVMTLFSKRNLKFQRDLK